MVDKLWGNIIKEIKCIQITFKTLKGNKDINNFFLFKILRT